MISRNYAAEAIEAATEGKLVYCKFLSANDTGLTGGHQAGIYISKPSIPILFDEPGQKGELKEKWVEIEWQNNLITKTRFIYYGQKTRNEYRITNFGKGFPFLRHEYTGALFILVKNTEVYYRGYVLNSEEEIEEFLDSFGIGPTSTNRLIDTELIRPEKKEQFEMESFISTLEDEFPSSDIMSSAARSINQKAFHNKDMIINNPDKILIEWTDSEYRL